MKVYGKPTDRMYKRYMLRYLSILPTQFFIRHGMTPNEVTAISGVAAICGIALMVVPNPLYWLYGWLFLLGYGVLDSSDGQIARLTSKVTELGDFFDTLVHVMVDTFIFLAMGLSLKYYVAGIVASWCMAMFHVIHLLKGLSRGESKVKTIKKLSPFKRLASTTSMIITCVLLSATAEILTGLPFRSLFLLGCSVLFPIVLVKKAMVLIGFGFGIAGKTR